MKKPKICAAITSYDPETINKVEGLVDLFEVRIDLLGDEWTQVPKQLSKPWIACNRMVEEGGRWQGTEARRIEKLFQAIELGAAIVDLEIRTKSLGGIIPVIKKRAKCLLSYHNLKKTPTLSEMKEIVERQLKAGADICKVISTAQTFDDNITALKLISEFSGVRLVSFGMGASGVVSRILCPLVGGDFTYASIERGRESAEGQLTVAELAQIYGMIKE
ncbi:MAG: type I 3-dehydroquinate dehydratase [Chloroflexota bacterium]